MSPRTARLLIALLGIAVRAIGSTETRADAVGILAVVATFVIAIPLGFSIVSLASARHSPSTADRKVSAELAH